jgi:hypothetical protein
VKEADTHQEKTMATDAGKKIGPNPYIRCGMVRIGVEKAGTPF